MDTPTSSLVIWIALLSRFAERAWRCPDLLAASPWGPIRGRLRVWTVDSMFCQPWMADSPCDERHGHGGPST